MTADDRERLAVALLWGSRDPQQLGDDERADLARALETGELDDTLRSAALVERLLGADPATTEAAAAADSPGTDAEAAERQRAELAAAAAAGLAEAARLEAGLARAQRDDALFPLMLPTLSQPPRAFAADTAGTGAPALPETRRVLFEDDGQRLTLYREAARLVLALFVDDAADVDALAVILDGVALEPRESTPTARIVEIGALTALRGAELTVTLGERFVGRFRLL